MAQIPVEKLNRRNVHSSAAPTAGTWQAGDKVWNTAPAPGGTLCWACTADGTPGTWTTVPLAAG